MAVSTSLSTKIVFLMISVSVVSIIALATISINISHEALKKDAAQRLNVIASDRMQALKNNWNQQLQQVEALASDKDIQAILELQKNDDNLFAEEESKENEIAAKLDEETFKKFLSLTSNKDTLFANIYVLDDKENLVSSANAASDNEDIGFALQIMQNYQQERGTLLKPANPYYYIAYDDNRKATSLLMVAPAFASTSSEINSAINQRLGTIVVVKDIESANNILGDKRFLGETGEAYLVDSNGLMLTDSRFEDNARYREVVKSAPVEACFANGADINSGQYISYRGNLVFGASQCERNIGIALLSEQDNAELFAPIVSLQERYTVIILGIIVAAASVSFYLSISILRPLQKLRTIMKTVQSGIFQKADITRSDEIGELANSFNSMVNELEIRAKKLRERNDILEDMTARLNAYAQALFKADKEKEEFSAMISDEMKRFLIPIIGYCELILDGSLGDIGKESKEKIEIMLERAWSLKNLVQNIIDVRRLESGMLKMNMRPDIAVSWVVQQCIDKVQPITHSKGITIDVAVDGRIKFECDPDRIVQMLENLLEFSIRRTLEANKQSIRIKAGLSSDVMEREISVIFAIEDDGGRISEGQGKNILENKFYNLDTSFTRTAGGTDIGIIIARSIIEAHKGRIAIQSKEGKCTTFIIAIPLNQNLNVSATAE